MLGAGKPDWQVFSGPFCLRKTPSIRGCTTWSRSPLVYSSCVPGLSSVCRRSPRSLLRVLPFGSWHAAGLEPSSTVPTLECFTLLFPLPSVDFLSLLEICKISSAVLFSFLWVYYTLKNHFNGTSRDPMCTGQSLTMSRNSRTCAAITVLPSPASEWPR